MNYYERHIGDYLKDTAHLSLLEHGVYTRLMDVYYTREGAIPVAEAARLIGARSKDEREALAAVLAEFFVESEGAYMQVRCEREIERFRDKQRKAKASAEARWSKSERNADAYADAMRSHTEGNAPRARPQSPDTSKDISKPSASHPPDKPAGKKLPQVPCPYAEIVGLYHDLLPTMPAVRLMDGKTGEKRKKAMRAMWGWVLSSRKPDGSPRAESAEQALQWFRTYFGRAAENDFLMGRTPRSPQHQNWRCDLDFLLTEAGMKQVIEKTQAAA